MGLISLRTATQLYWLGRYVQRALDLLHRLHQTQATEATPVAAPVDATVGLRFEEFCECLGIESEFENRNAFLQALFFKMENGYSILFSLSTAYENGVFLRNTIGHEGFAYLRLALNTLESLQVVNFYDVKPVIDYLYAFWGSIDECADRRVRAMVRWGKWVEIRDLAGRFEDSDDRLEKAVWQLQENLHVLEVDEHLNVTQALDREGGIEFTNELFTTIYRP